MRTQIELYWLTTTGAEWLNETVEITPETFSDVMTEYYDRTLPLADSLENKWRTDGEDVSIFFEANNIDTPIEFYRTVELATFDVF